ncbi:MAG: hypothetical protein KUG75_09800 [Pseudomonadales bacterium]|nr:hypothetical protein [Pseudomonadales bacterium]
MSLRLDKQWVALNEQTVSALKAELGVFQLGDANKDVVYVGRAGSQSLFGLRGELEKHIGSASYFRTEITSSYSTRFQELMMLHHADFGDYPPLNSAPDKLNLGRLSPA